MSNPDVTISYEDAVEEIEAILVDIDDGALPIDELAPKVERAASLLAHCRAVLQKTEARVQDAVAALSGPEDE
ncbi:MAG: exodeoxyribonuclease VII small subunit [Bradymonadia bacterium]|jgi:exodeoxyribonuclease VII small subunit